MCEAGRTPAPHTHTTITHNCNLQVTNSGDHAAAFHLARQYEAAGRIPEAVRYYTLVGQGGAGGV